VHIHMANTGYDARKAFMDYYVYVPLGAGKLAIDKGRELVGTARKMAEARRETAIRTYGDLARRGEKLATSIRRQVWTRRAVEQSKAAAGQVRAVGTQVGEVRKQVRTAAGSVRKAARSTATATRSAAQKVG
jgi:hypothetical protein